jgi:FkbM family methyltransferase
VIDALGRAAALARRAGLEAAARKTVGAADAVLLRSHRPPLRAQTNGVVLRGFLRHRSYLAETMRPRATYAQLFTGLLEPRMTVVDGGAHVGLFTLLAARTAELVFAVEPDEYNLAALRANVAGLRNVEVVPEALSESKGTATFYATRSTIGSSLLERGDAVPHAVRTTSIDLLLQGRDIHSLLIKLNIEGAEPLALAGARDSLARVGHVAILLEVNPPLLAAAGTDIDAVLRGLRAEGFEIGYVDLPSQRVVALPEPLPKGHLLASRTARP